MFPSFRFLYICISIAVVFKICGAQVRSILSLLALSMVTRHNHAHFGVFLSLFLLASHNVNRFAAYPSLMLTSTLSYGKSNSGSVKNKLSLNCLKIINMITAPKRVPAEVFCFFFKWR